MLTKTVVGRKSLNAMLRHIAFHGHIEVPCEYRQRFEHSVVKQLHVDGKVTTSRNGRGEYIIVSRNGMLYEESCADLFESVNPLVVHLALENPRIEHLTKVFRKNQTVPVLREIQIAEQESYLDID